MILQVTIYYIFLQMQDDPSDPQQLILQVMTGEMENDEKLQILRSYLASGRREQVRNLAKETLSIKAFKKLEPTINKLEERKREPIKNSKKLREYYGIDLFLLETGRNVFDQKLTGDIKTALIVGMTGVGKSTFLNSLVNCIMGVESDDPFRYVIVDDFKSNQSQSVTTEVTTYVIKRQGNMKSSFVLVDVPGIGDTRGIDIDKQNLVKIKQKLEKNVPELNLILYVFKASDTRITSEVEYVMSQVMSMFAKDVAGNFLFILTFADAQVPPIAQHLKKSFEGVVAGLNKDDWYLKVNNSSIFMKIDPCDPIAVNGFKTGMVCLQKTIDRLLNAKIVSTKTTVSVMDTIKQIENYIKALHMQMDILLADQDRIRQLVAQVANTKADALGKKGFKFTVSVTKLRTKPTSNNVTVCLNCKFTCHDNCSFSNGADKINCSAMVNGNCTCCPKKCSWKFHDNSHEIIEYYTAPEEQTNEDLMMQYNVKINEKNAKEQLLSQMVFKYIKNINKTSQIVKNLKSANEDLHKIQLFEVKPSSIIDYLQMLIISEKKNKKEGYLARVNQLQDMKQMQKRKSQALSQDEKQFSQEQVRIFIDSIIKDNQVKAKVEKEVKKEAKKKDNESNCEIM